MARKTDRPSRRLSRRAFLGGAGAAIALPFLESLWPKSRRAAQAAVGEARRLVFFYVPCGMHMPSFKPAETGADYVLPPSLTPLADLKDELLVLTGLANLPGKSDGGGDHAAGTGAFLSAFHVNKSESDIENAITVDQVAASAIGGETPFPSLQLGIDGGGTVGDCDSGYSCAYTRNISWAGPQSPLPKIVSPRILFDRLFQGFDPAATEAERTLRKKHRKSVLDYAVGQAQSLSGRLGRGDKQKLEQYLTGVRELEKRLDAGVGQCEPPLPPPSDSTVDEHVTIMMDLMVVALQCDLSRIVSFMLANAGSNRNYSWLDDTISGSHHDLSHHNDSEENFRQLEIINRWEVSKFAYLARRLSELEDTPGATLLDNSLVLFGSEISDGDRHSHFDMPYLMAGRGGGEVSPGRHLSYSNDEPVADLFISMLTSVGVEVDTFGDDGTGPLANIIS